MMISIFGAVQGVGFRPFIYKLATDLGIKGEVYNDSQGVKIILNKDENAQNLIDEIYKNLPKLAPLARIDKILVFETNSKIYSRFSITESKNTSKFSPILPDYAICDECKSEFYDKNSRFYHYAFINCTNCGPRLSVIKNLPYDRKNTSMAKFKMCKECENEYENPLNRRFHAEPTSCNKCGVTLYLKNLDKEILNINEDAIKSATNLLNDGKILAIKGLGGFHLMCDALNPEAIKNLRIRKNRPTKPFAVMVKDIKMAKDYAEISSDEQNLMSSKISPIVLLKSKGKMPQSIAFNTDKIGLFIAPTGLHLLLFEYFQNPIIATSANLGGETIIYDEDTLLKKLSGVIDFYIDNNRDIITPSDDSVAFVADKKAHFLRTSRGINPKIFLSKYKIKGSFLALGAEMKNQFAIYKDGLIIISPYIGDLKNRANFDRFLEILDIFTKGYDIKFDKIIADLHPNFIHTNYFKKQGFKVEKVQHHYAHLISNLFENSLPQKNYIGFSFDGTGYAKDAKIWGGEVLNFNYHGFKRIYHFDEFLLLGGEASIKDISRLKYAIFKKYNISQQSNKILDLIYEKEINSLKTSSLGRIFDAFAAVVFNLSKVSYDGEAGMLVEKFYDKNINDAYEFNIENGVIIYKDAFLGALKDDKKTSCSKFINGLANLIVKITKDANLEPVLSGGVFQNQTLVEILSQKFKKNGIIYHFNHEIPTNDSGVAIGQLIWYLKNGAKNG
ncbi:carbamoyltransferase HypF [Campylobacter corcagiensis]|uniref:Carbamoyltransferase n=1 Tax=Campylobacter corcagiensis TaxID=1448857 RepID=A0A7M1LEV4_9BACT|nr:carbamoyltransferase HypF [Campylobacter corcagiensis]QKF64737.1 [Ni-Fe] hydrogenase maturation protein HypF [Campylobacter corcagiensis]QOQ87099.1 carbamoyltransferase HypF [Campylobacter corcagiensis]